MLFRSDAGASAVAGALRHVPLLRSLDISKNRIGNAGAAALLEVLPRMPLLCTFSAGANPIDGALQAALARAVEGRSRRR